MTLPESAYGALMGIGASLLVWGAQAFIKQQQPPPQSPPAAAPAPRSLDARTDGYIELSARDWINIMAAIEKQFNGRYWLASEGRDEMQRLRDHADQQTQRLHERISKLGHDIDAKLQRQADRSK